MESDKLYTFLLEYDGGTFVSQVWASSIEIAKLKWCGNLSFEAIEAPISQRESFLKSVADEVAVPVSGLGHVWCLAPSLGNKMALVHIVETT